MPKTTKKRLLSPDAEGLRGVAAAVAKDPRTQAARRVLDRLERKVARLEYALLLAQREETTAINAHVAIATAVWAEIESSRLSHALPSRKPVPDRLSPTTIPATPNPMESAPPPFKSGDVIRVRRGIPEPPPGECILEGGGIVVGYRLPGTVEHAACVARLTSSTH